MYYLPTDDVLKLAEINFQGNIIPSSWYKEITKPNGKPDPVAIMILSEIVYWYRPLIVRDPHTNVDNLYRKFHDDALQKSYKQLSDSLGFTEKQLRTGLLNLERLGLASRDFRTILMNKKIPLNNVMFLLINPIRIKEITYTEVKKCLPSLQIGKEVVPKKETGGSQKGNTYTKTTPKTSSKISKETMSQESELPQNPVKPKGEEKTMASFKFNDKTLDIAKRWRLSEENMNSFYWLKDMQIPTDQNTMAYWAKKYSLQRLQDVFYEAKSYKPDYIANYMQKLLKTEAFVLNANAEKNREFAESYKKETKSAKMKICKNYVKIPYKDDYVDIYFNLQPEAFMERFLDTIKEY